MADISFLSEDSTLARIDRHIETVAAGKKPRRYLGMSEIGDECERRLWLKYHTDFREIHSGQTLRRFDTGHTIERRVVRDLRAAGFTVSARQLKFSTLKGAFKGHCDGIVEGLIEAPKTPHILEVKSSNDKWYREFTKNGMASNTRYAAQIHLYMRFAGLTRGLFILENKNDSARYMERVHYDETIADAHIDKARRIIDAATPPIGISSRPDWYICKLCPLNSERWCRRSWGEVPF